VYKIQRIKMHGETAKSMEKVHVSFKS